MRNLEKLIDAIEECDGGPRVVAKLRMHATLDYDLRKSLLTQIEKAGKGRVAQRLSGKIMGLDMGSRDIPGYISDAINYLIKGLKEDSTLLAEFPVPAQEEDEIPF